jgi:hypothetical protein
MTTDTEARLRAALRAGAELITVEPAELPELPSRRHKYWVVWALAAAAVVIAIAALSVVAGHSPRSAPRHSRSVAPAHHPSTVRSVSPPTLRGLHPATCVASNGDSIRQALRAGLIPISGPEHTEQPIVGVDARGQVVVVYSDEIRVHGPGHASRAIYTAPSSLRLDDGRIGSLPEPVFDGDWVAFATEPKRHGSPGLSHLGVVNIQSGDVRMIYNRVGSSVLRRPILVHGVVYWTVTDLSGSGLVYSYDIASGERHTVDSGQLGGPFTVGGGVYWAKDQSLVTHIPGVLPPGYVVQTKPSANPVFVVDGARVAWVRGDDILVRQAGGPSVSVYHSTAGVQPQVVALVGPYLVWHDSVQYDLKLIILDLRTGATARLTQIGPAVMPVGTPTGHYLVLDIRDGLFTPPTVVDTARAPRLRC